MIQRTNAIGKENNKPKFNTVKISWNELEE